MKMTFQEIRIIATGPCITNQLPDVNTICRRSWYLPFGFKEKGVSLRHFSKFEKIKFLKRNIE
jgi:hypothetical protein